MLRRVIFFDISARLKLLRGVLLDRLDKRVLLIDTSTHVFQRMPGIITIFINARATLLRTKYILQVHIEHRGPLMASLSRFFVLLCITVNLNLIIIFLLILFRQIKFAKKVCV